MKTHPIMKLAGVFEVGMVLAGVVLLAALVWRLASGDWISLRGVGLTLPSLAAVLIGYAGSWACQEYAIRSGARKGGAA